MKLVAFIVVGYAALVFGGLSWAIWKQRKEREK